MEAEGLPLSLVRAAEAVTRGAVAEAGEPEPDDAELAGVLFLAEAAIRRARLPEPVPVAVAADLLGVLRAEGLADDEVLTALPRLPVAAETADAVSALLGR